MCGIFGVTNFDIGRVELAQNALHTLKHRGPDQWNDYYDDHVYLGHRRLSILDLSENGRQPMVSEDDAYRIIVNGEIYNYLDFKDQLKHQYKFFSTSDSEVLLHGYREWGIEELLEKIDGMFAFAIYDKRNMQLHIVRDRVGIKPLFYSCINQQVVFASELKAIQAYLSDSDLEIDSTSLYDFLTHKYIPTPKTLYKNIYKLEPGNRLLIDLATGSINKYPYWKLEVQNNRSGIDEAVVKIRELVHESVSEQMMSDVPVGFFLSGGLDSSTIVATASTMNKDLNTFSIGFTDQTHDETHYADIVANAYKTNHIKKILDLSETESLIQYLKQWC